MIVCVKANDQTLRDVGRCGAGMIMKDLNEEALVMIAARFRALSDPTRLRIINTLSDKEMSVTELVNATGANQANVSKHLSTLLQAGIVSRRKDGLTANYRVSDPTIFDLCDLVCSRIKDDLDLRKKAFANTRNFKK
jgi:DNA-binding transcriptional ArsR family regulator